MAPVSESTPSFGAEQRQVVLFQIGGLLGFSEVFGQLQSGQLGRLAVGIDRESLRPDLRVVDSLLLAPHPGQERPPSSPQPGGSQAR